MEGYEEGEDELYASDAEEEEEEECGRGGAAVRSDDDGDDSDEDGGAWEMRPAHGRAAAAEPSPDDADDYDEDEEDDDDAALVVQGLQRRQQTGHLTARQRAMVEPESVTAAALEFPGGLLEAVAKPGKRKLCEDSSPDAALRKLQAKQRIKEQKDNQLREAREAATAKILSGDTSRKRQAVKAAKEQEERLADRRADVAPKPGFVRIKRGPAGGVVAFAPGEGPYWLAA